MTRNLTSGHGARSARRQHGNTLMGIIIGLVIGLVIAVGVALVIKGANPFLDKPVKIGKMSEPTAGQASDPNKPLYGNKEAARAANKEFAGKQKTEGEATDAAAATATVATPATAAVKPETPKPAAAAPATPATAAATPAPTAPATAAAEPEDKTIYYLQAGAFRELNDAENTRAKLALLGFEAAITELSNDSGVLHRVRIGPYPQVDAMKKARAKLLDSGIDVAIVRNQK